MPKKKKPSTRDIEKGYSMGMSILKKYWRSRFFRNVTSGFLLATAIFFSASCSRTISVYYPPRLDLAPYGRLGMITFSDNAQPSVAEYATEQFQNQVHAAQMGIPIVELGTEEAVLKHVRSDRLDSEAMKKIGQEYDVSAVFHGSVVYSDVKPNVTVKDITKFRASVDATLHATLSVKLIETEGAATVWSDSTSWQRKLAKVRVDENAGISVGTQGYDDAYRKLIPDMVHDVTRDFRGMYVKERVDK